MQAIFGGSSIFHFVLEIAEFFNTSRKKRQWGHSNNLNTKKQHAPKKEEDNLTLTVKLLKTADGRTI